MNVSDSSEVVIEEIDSNDVTELELSEFQETEPIQVFSILNVDDDEQHGLVGAANLPNVDEANLIQRYVHGEADFPDMYTKLEPYEEDDVDDEEDEGEEEDYDDAAADVPMRDQQSFNMSVEDTNNAMDGMTQMETAYQQVDTSLQYNYGWRHKPGRRRKKRGDDVPSTSRNARGGANAAAGVGARKKSLLNAALQGLMGEANLCFARGQLQMAEKICLEIIRQNPLAPEPFFTLAEIYESRDTEKFLNFLTIAVHLNPSDRYQWIRIAEMHIAQGNLQRARLYYTRAIKVHFRDYDLRLRKARLLDMMGEKSHAMFAYLKMIQHCPPERHELCLVTAKNVARHFHA